MTGTAFSGLAVGADVERLPGCASHATISTRKNGPLEIWSSSPIEGSLLNLSRNEFCTRRRARTTDGETQDS